MPGGIISGTGVSTGTGTPTRVPGIAGAFGSGAGNAGAGGGVYGRIEEASALAALTSIGSLPVPSQTTNHRLLGAVRAALAAAVPTTPAQI